MHMQTQTCMLHTAGIEKENSVKPKFHININQPQLYRVSDFQNFILSDVSHPHGDLSLIFLFLLKLILILTRMVELIF